MRTSTLLCALLPAFLAGCAWYDIRPISARETANWATGEPPSAEGYIFYQPELYFAVTIATAQDANGKNLGDNVTVAPVYLPNYQKPYRVSTHNVLAKADFS